MLDKIKSAVSAVTPLYDQKWIFLSGFDSFDKLIGSNWVITTDRTLETIIVAIYSQIFAAKASNLEYVVIDIVTWYEEIKDANILSNSDPKIYGFGFQDSSINSISTILPNTTWVWNIGQTIAALKSKAHSTSSQVNICRFTTTRIIVKK